MNIEYQKKVKLGRDKMAQARNSVLTTRRAYAPSLVTLHRLKVKRWTLLLLMGSGYFITL